MDVEHAMRSRERRELHLRKVHRADGGARVRELGERVGDLATNRLLGLRRGPADVRREDDVRQPTHDAREVVRVALRLLRIDVERSARELLGFDRGRERVEIDDRPAAQVDEVRALLHHRELGGADHALRLRRLRHVQRDEVARAQQRLERVDGLVVPHRERGPDVIGDDAHAHRLGEHADLRADVPVADDAERLAAHFEGGGRDLAPLPLVDLARAIAELPREHDHLADDELGDAPRVAERRVEHGHAALVRGLEVDLVRADAEGPDRQKPLARLERAARDLGFASDSEEMNALGRASRRARLP